MFKSIFIRILTRLGGDPNFTLKVVHSDGSTHNFGASAPSLTLEIKSAGLYRRLVINPSLGLAEGYAEGKIEIHNSSRDGLFEFLKMIASVDLEKAFPALTPWKALRNRFNFQGNSLTRSRKNVQVHYDANDEIVRLITGQTKQYSCAYFAESDWSLDQAQQGKMQHILSKLLLGPNMTLLDVGCGYGELLRQAARKTGARGLGITLSRKQLDEGTTITQKQNLRDLCQIKLSDYREISGKFDRIVSVGMFEHVGRQNWKNFFTKMDSLLADGGVFVLHTVCRRKPAPMDTFVSKHIFPGSELPTFAVIMENAEATRFQCRDFENLQRHYSKTLLCWLDNLRANRDNIIQRFGAWHYRAFEIYLAGGAASFTAPDGMQLGQFIFTKGQFDWPATREWME